MGGINVARWILGGLVAGVLLWLMEGALSVVYMEDMAAAMAEHGLSMEMSTGLIALTVVVSLLVGLVAVFFYAASRPRFGPGPRTAAIVGVALWSGSTLVALLGYHMIDLYPPRMLLHWGLIGLAEMIVISIAGAAIYTE